MTVTSSKLQPLNTNIMQEQYATKSACGWKHSKRVYAKKKNVQPCLEHSLHQRRKNAASKFISSVSNMLRMGPRQPLDCHKTQDGKQIKQPLRWCCSWILKLANSAGGRPKITPEYNTHGTCSETCEARAFAAKESCGMCDANGGGLSGVLTSGNFFVE